MSAHSLRFVAFVCLIIANSSAQAEYGRTSGSFDVSSSGSASYSLPIWTPPGPNGMTPDIALNYSSQQGNGLGGVGWNLTVGSSIERCPRNRHQDVNGAPVDLTMADRFCLGDERLRVVSGTYGASGSVYFTEIANYSRITAYGSAGNGPAYFIVEAKSGLLYEYGNSTSSRVFPGVSPTISTTPNRWMLNKVYDRSGNNYVISYNNLNGFAVPNVVAWTPTYAGSSSYRYEAKFNYMNSRTDIDAFKGRVAGFEIKNHYRLQSIQIKSNGAVKRKYVFTYDTSSVTSRSRLTAARECVDDAESNCFLPLLFAYQTGVAGVTSGLGIAPAGSSNGLIPGRFDFNGDGKDDIIYKNGSTWDVAFSTGTGFAGPYSTGITGTALPDRFLPKGRDGIATIVSGKLHIYHWDDATSAFVATNTGITSAVPSLATDYNGDGLADLLYYTSSSPTLTIRPNTSTGSGIPSFSTGVITNTLPTNSVWGMLITSTGAGLRHADFNGDGKQDLYAVIVTTNPPNPGATQKYVNLLAQNTGYLSGTSYSSMTGPNAIAPALNFNGDKCSDLVQSSVVYISPCKGSPAATLVSPAAAAMLLDWNGDGKTDLLANNGGAYGVYLSTGAGLSSMIATSIPAPGGFAVDQDGDGLDDLLKPNGSGAVSYWTHTATGSSPSFSNNIPDLLSGVTDGFGISHFPNYVSTASSNYDKGADTTFPLQESRPLIVVGQVTSSNGIGSTYNKTYYYVGARVHAERGDWSHFQGKKFVGFQRVDETDSRNGLISRKYFDQVFPLSGMVSQLELMQANGVTPIARKVFTNSFTTLESAAGHQRFFRYPSAEISTEFELGGSWNGSLMKTETTTNTFDNASGTLYDKTLTTTEHGSANGVNAGAVWTARTYLPTLITDVGNWCLGRPSQTQQINSHNLLYGASTTRTVDTAWDTSYCRPTKTTVEPGSATLKVTTDIGYDVFGNVNSSTVTGIGMSPRTTVAVYSDASFTSGQFPLSFTNALGQTTINAWNYDLGVLSSSIDANGLAESWLYDAWGRRTKHTRTDGTATTWTINSCSGVSGGCIGSQNKTVVVETDLNNAGNSIKDAWVYLDQLDRVVVESNRLLGGNYDRIDREYDGLGRVHRESAPCLWASCTNYWTTYSYDLVDRPTQSSRPKSDSNPSLQYSYVYYEGLTTRAIDPQGKQSSQTENAVGELVRSTDHNGYYQAFDYDALGLPKRVQDSAGNILQSSTYNMRGMLSARTDMDMGAWSFTSNALGETVSQTDANGNTTSFQFDLLGRMIQRTEVEGTSTWTWGTSSTAKNIGRLSGVAGPGYSESYTYTAASQPSSRIITVGSSTFEYSYSYNNEGKLNILTYPTSTSGYRLKVKHEYQNGELYRMSDSAAPSTVFWTANASDARNQVTQETLGNGLVTNRSMDSVTGWLKAVQTGLGGGSSVQNLSYTWDLAGNLKTRRDVNQSNLTEEFFYDNLYRLDYSKLNSVMNLNMDYDALGNIVSKSDVGSYTYDVAKKHQVSSTSNGWTFDYDDNGNMTNGRGSTIGWTSYNYPASIVNGANTSTFSYTPDRQYYKQVSNYSSGGTATTIYAGGLFEKVTTSAGTDFRHLILAGGSTIIVSRQSSGTNSVHYVTRDHLGSSSAITNASGAILVNSSFDAFGKRRGANWSGSPSTGDWTAIAATTRRGYTEHTMLDNLNLIHMNGRVHDPVLGRFVSADPYIVDPAFTQNYNRYSYVYNNPLSLIDPSGFVDCHSTNANSGSRLDGWDQGEAVTPSEVCLDEVVVTGNRGDEAEELPEIVVTATRSTGFVDFFLNSPQHIAASYGDNSWELAIWNVFVSNISGTAQEVSDGHYGGAALQAADAAIKPLRLVKRLGVAAKSLGRFEKKLPAGAGPTKVHDLPNGGKAFQAEVPGRVPGSKAVYEKQIDANGVTTGYTKTTYDPAGNIVHVKDKITGETFP